MKEFNILVIFDSAGTPPADQDYAEEFKKEEWFTEAAVVETLRLMGHQVKPFGIYEDIGILITEISQNRPDLIFNLTEIFNGKAYMDRNVPAFLEMTDIPFTGCGPDGLMLCNNKDLSKKILTYHRIKVPRFATFRKGKTVRMPSKMKFPVIVKPLKEEASTGIAQASYAENENDLRERIAFVHDNMGMHAIAEEYIVGREFYISIMGHKRLTAFPIREMKFGNVPDNEPKIATYKAKWDKNYREKWGLENVFAEDLPDAVKKKIFSACKRAYRALDIDGYARFDCRFTPENDLYILEANANPELAQGDEFAESAAKAGLDYDHLLQKIMNLALTRE
jgi:D-alanine-D-alanine ligase